MEVNPTSLARSFLKPSHNPGNSNFNGLYYFEPNKTYETQTTIVIRGVKTEDIRKGRILGRFEGYLEGIFGNPSLTKIPGKTWTNLRTYKNNIRK